MTGIEERILEVLRELKLADEEAIGRKMGVPSKSDHIKEICGSLMKSGHLSKTPEGYKITFKGKNAIGSAIVK